MKVAQVILIYEAGDPTRPNNYRPISILTIFSKIFEKHIYITNYSYIYIEKHNVISDQQCGFHKGVSTNIAIAKFIREKWIKLKQIWHWYLLRSTKGI